MLRHGCTGATAKRGLLMLWAACATMVMAAQTQARVLRVPADQPTIQAAIDGASDGDAVVIAAGVYRENVSVRNKSITLASEYIDGRDRRAIERTVIDGGGGDAVVEIVSDGEQECVILGLTLCNADDGVACKGAVQLLHCRITDTKDGIDCANGRAVCRENIFERNRDDGIDLDGASSGVIEDNIIRDNDNDGIEIRLHAYSGPRLEIVVRRNLIAGNLEDGIQIIDYPDRSDRVIRIEGNLIAGNAMAGVGCMGDGKTRENYEGADIPERILLINNTFVDHVYGVAGGDNLIALNNIFANTKETAVYKVDGDSVAAFNLFWNNGVDFAESQVDMRHTIAADPKWDARRRLAADSPATDAGTARFSWRGENVLDRPADAYAGSAPDLGAFEFDPDAWVVRGIVAHRGSSADRPENTVASTLRAVEAGATIVEIDVRTTKEGELVVLHDASLARTTGDAREIGEVTLADLERLDAGSWFDPRFADQRVPTVADLLRLCRGKVDVFLDLKEQGEPYAERVAEAVREHGEPVRTILGVRSIEQAKLFRRLLDEARQVGLIPAQVDVEAFVAAGVDAVRLWPHWLTEPKLVERVRATGAYLQASAGLATEAELELLGQYRPDVVSSDDPARLAAELVRRRAWNHAR